MGEWEKEIGGINLFVENLDRPWGMRTAAFSDPAGHFWELAQELPG
jgi:lactoylglutathione lyase